MVVQVAVLLVFATLLPVGAVQSASLPSPALASAGSAQEGIRNDSASQRSTHPLPLDHQPDTLALPSLFVRPDTPPTVCMPFRRPLPARRGRSPLLEQIRS